LLVTDAQIHIWEPNRLDRPWVTGLQRPAHRPNGFSAQEILAQMDAVGVDRAVIVPPNWVGDCNDTVLEAAARHSSRLGVVGRFNPKAEDARTQLEDWLRQAHMLGVRATFHTRPYIDWLDDGSLDWFWELCERQGIPVMALVPGMARKLLPIAERHRNLTVLIPHMACLLDSRGTDAFSNLGDLLELARYPRMFVMVSAAACYSNEPYPFLDIQPYIKLILSAFGPQRMLWGSDLSRLKCSYRECLDLFRVAIDFLSQGDRDWILGKTLAEALNWPET
jgi:predicted TIM-barrel fold metal-dependent hydrolase